MALSVVGAIVVKVFFAGFIKKAIGLVIGVIFVVGLLVGLLLGRLFFGSRR
jgi:hypothetical protein